MHNQISDLFVERMTELHFDLCTTGYAIVDDTITNDLSAIDTALHLYFDKYDQVLNDTFVENTLKPLLDNVHVCYKNDKNAVDTSLHYSISKTKK